MDLGKSLRQLVAKITNAPVVDEKAVKSFIRDLQRVLIASDVSVKLVFDLTKRIETRALKSEKLEGLTLREHLLKIVHDELVSFMGESYEPRMDKHKILLMGLFGAGKCVHKDTKIPLADNSVDRIESIYDAYKSMLGEEKIEDGYAINCKGTGPEIYSFNPETLKIEKRKASRLWKLKKKGKLLRVWLDNGNDHSIIVTPEHPFFILEKGRVTKVRADELQAGMAVAIPNLLPNSSVEAPEFREELFSNYPNLLVIDLELATKLRSELKARYGTLKSAHKVLGISRAFCTFVSDLKHEGAIPLQLLKGKEFSCKEVTVREMKAGSPGGAARPVRLPTVLSEDLAEFLGYVLGDGHLTKNTIGITNVEPEILARLNVLGEKLFGLTGSIKTDRRNGVTTFMLSSKILVNYLVRVFGVPVGNKASTMRLPPLLSKSPNRIARSFLQAYFDADGHICKRRNIEFSSASSEFIEDLQALLLRFRLCPSKSVRSIKGKNYYRLFLRGRDVESFGKEISSILPRKLMRLQQSLEIGLGQTPGKHQMIPAGPLLKTVREWKGVPIGEIQNHVSSYGIYESNQEISRDSLCKFLSAIEKGKSWKSLLSRIESRPDYYGARGIESKNWANAVIFRLCQQGYVREECGSYSLTDEGQAVLDYEANAELCALEKLAYSDVCWLPVSKVSTVPEQEFVYDFTVDGTHTFVANGIVVHNTSTVGKIAYFYKKRGFKVGVVGADVERPAAQEQLQQLSEQIGVNFYTVKGEPDAYKVVQDALSRSEDDILIVDSAGRSAFDSRLADELSAIGKTLKPEESYLVMSADVGQVAGKQAEEFNSLIPVTGVIVTKMDGSGKGGGALSAVASTGSKISFIGLGEKMEDFQVYDPSKYVGRLLGIPDIEGLMEKVKLAAEEAQVSPEDIQDFTIEAFYQQLKAAKKMGPLGGLFSMMGMSDVPEELVNQGEGKLKQYESIINSMTKEERKDASLIRKSRSRMERIAKGSGASLEDIRMFLSQFSKMEKMFTRFRKDRGFRKKMEKMMKGGGGMGNINLPGVGI